MIRFHWAGKGTTAAPKRGIYGPLVSPIFVDSDFSPPVDGKIAVGAVVLVLLLIFDFRHSLVEGLYGREDIKGKRSCRWPFKIGLACKTENMCWHSKKFGSLT